MLVLSRKPGEKVRIGSDITLVVLESLHCVGQSEVRIGEAEIRPARPSWGGWRGGWAASERLAEVALWSGTRVKPNLGRSVPEPARARGVGNRGIFATRRQARHWRVARPGRSR